MAEGQAGTLRASTCCFNPMGYRRRLANYRVFRQHRALHLLPAQCEMVVWLDCDIVFASAEWAARACAALVLVSFRGWHELADARCRFAERWLTLAGRAGTERSEPIC